MKTKKLLGIFFLFLCTITLVSCGDDEKQEIYSLSFEKGYYERPLLGAKNIPVRGGNRDYTVTVQNTDVLSIDIDLSSPIDMGNLVVKPKQKGETTITVKDNVTNETVDLKIKIVDSYLNLKVAHPAQVPYTGGENLFFINNSDRDFYLFDEKMEKKECTGNYQFLIKNSTCYMILNFDAMGDDIKKASEGYKTYADIKDIPQEAAIVTLAWKNIIEGVNDTNFAPDDKIDEKTFRWLQNAFGNDTEIKYNSVMSRAQAAYEIYYRLLDNGVYITKFDLGSGIYMPNEPWNKDENGNQKEYVFSDEISQSLSLQHKGEFVRMTLNWRSTMNGFYYADNHREHAIYSQVFRWHEMNDKWSAHGNGYMASPLGLRRINIAKYGNYIIIMNCSDEDKAVNVELEADVSKIHDLVTDTMMDVNNSITMPALSTIVLDLRETN